jgi:hypothetical protein
MTSRDVFIAFAITVAAVAAANLAVGRAASNSVPRQTMRNINAAGPVINVLGIGNSLMAAGFDEAAVQQTFRKTGHIVVAINGGLGASGSIEHLDFTRLALHRHMVRDLVYGFSDQQMATEPPLKNSDLIGNRAMLYYDEPQLTLKYARFDGLEWLEFQTFRCCALFRERSAIWAKVEKVRRTMQEVGMPRQETNRFGRRADFDLLEAANTEQFVLRCREVMRSRDFLSPPLQELFKEARAHGSRVTVVEMPTHPLHLKRFYDQPIWEEFQRKNRAAIEEAGASYLDASRWVPDESDFQDHFHLSERGAAEFSRKLADELLRRGDTLVSRTP